MPVIGDLKCKELAGGALDKRVCVSVTYGLVNVCCKLASRLMVSIVRREPWALPSRSWWVPELVTWYTPAERLTPPFNPQQNDCASGPSNYWIKDNILKAKKGAYGEFQSGNCGMSV